MCFLGQAPEEVWVVGLGWRRGQSWEGEDSAFSEPGRKVKRTRKMEVLGQKAGKLVRRSLQLSRS